MKAYLKYLGVLLLCMIVSVNPECAKAENNVCGDLAEHSGGTPVYTWNASNTELTATRTCANNADHIETETVSVTVNVTRQPTCTKAGEAVYTSGNFENAAFSAKSKTLSVRALGHDIMTDTAVDPTCTTDGLTEGSHCSRCGLVFTAQKTIAKTGHSWGTPFYTWSTDNTKLTAYRMRRRRRRCWIGFEQQAASEREIHKCAATNASAGSVTTDHNSLFRNHTQISAKSFSGTVSIAAP